MDDIMGVNIFPENVNIWDFKRRMKYRYMLLSKYELCLFPLLSQHQWCLASEVQCLIYAPYIALVAVLQNRHWIDCIFLVGVSSYLCSNVSARLADHINKCPWMWWRDLTLARTNTPFKCWTRTNYLSMFRIEIFQLPSIDKYEVHHTIQHAHISSQSWCL